jgi:hypothetical protein
MGVSPLRAGLALGGALALAHAAWALLVWTGWAQPLADFIFWIHFIRPAWTVMPFDLGKAVLLVLVTGLGGLALGWLLALLWNGLLPRGDRGRRGV